MKMNITSSQFESYVLNNGIDSMSDGRASITDEISTKVLLFIANVHRMSRIWSSK